MKKKIPVHNCEFVNLSTLMPDSWKKWFKQVVSEEDNVPFRFGNNISLVPAWKLASHCKSCDLDDLAPEDEVTEFFETLDKYGKIYVNLEG